MTAHLFAPPARDYRAQIARLDRETAARMRDTGTADGFTLRGAPPAVYTPVPLFEPEPEPQRGPDPLPGQLTLAPTDEPDHEPARYESDRPRPLPARGAPCRVRGIGACAFYREHIGPTGAVSWLVIDEHCRQYHAARPEQVRVTRPKKRV